MSYLALYLAQQSIVLPGAQQTANDSLQLSIDKSANTCILNKIEPY